MSNALMVPRKNKRSEASRAIIDQYQLANAEEMQGALRDIFDPMFEAMLQGEKDAHRIFLCDEIALPEIRKSDVRTVEIILCEFTRVMF